MRFRAALPSLYVATPIETLEPRRLFSADLGRLASWADPGVVDPNSIPPEEAIVVEDVFTGDVGDEFLNEPPEYLWEELFVVDPLPADGEGLSDGSVDDGAVEDGEVLFDPAICYFGIPSGGEAEMEILTIADEPTDVATEDAGESDGEWIDPAVCYFGVPEGADVEILTVDVSVDVTLIDPAVCFPVDIALGEETDLTDLEVTDTGVEESSAVPADEILYTLYVSDIDSTPLEPEAAPTAEAALPFVQTSKAYEGIDGSDDSVADLVFANGDDDVPG